MEEERGRFHRQSVQRGSQLRPLEASPRNVPPLFEGPEAEEMICAAFFGCRAPYHLKHCPARRKR